ncbi:MAG: SMI1/KNR4 family protein [Syntrophobacterales bacterium]|nr:SMI1/KNR4 family protein [Syntrophobacterales bacterium]
MSKNLVCDDMIYNSLGVRLPEDYLNFISNHFKDLDDDPADHCCRKSGFGNLSFVIGTTQAFRNQFDNFPKKLVIIGYAGLKKVIINHQEMELDVFIGLDTETSEVFFVDTFGKIEKVENSFDMWVRNFIAWIKDRPISEKRLSLSNFIKLIMGKKRVKNDGR